MPSVDHVEYTEGPVQGTREFVEEYGYGIWDSPPNGGGGYSWTYDNDPNWERRETMGEAELAAYDLALFGPVVEEDADGSVERAGGCLDTPFTSLGTDAAYLAGVQDEASAFLAALGQDSRFTEVDAAWASCMADAGLADRSPAAAQQRLWDEYQGAVKGGTWPEPDVVAERADEERRLAVADLDCREATDWTARHRAIEIELQQEYVDTHRADLEALAAALASTSTGP